MDAVATPSPGTPYWAPSLRTRRRAQLFAVLVLTAMCAAAALTIYRSSARPNMLDAVDHAQISPTLSPTQAMHRTIDGITFPDWSHWGWTPQGGRTDHFGVGRTAATTRYTRGNEAVTFTIVSGVGSVDDGQLWPMPTFVNRGPIRFELLESTASPSTPVVDGNSTAGTVAVLKRHAFGRTVILTGSPATVGMRNQLRRLALRDVPSQQRTTPGNR